MQLEFSYMHSKKENFQINKKHTDIIIQYHLNYNPNIRNFFIEINEFYFIYREKQTNQNIKIIIIFFFLLVFIC